MWCGPGFNDGSRTSEGTIIHCTGWPDRTAGVVWRAKDANNYYVTRANALEDNVVLYKTVNGTRSPLDIVGRTGGHGIDIPVPANTWHTLRVDFKGSRFSVSFNGKPSWTKADSVTLFDEVTYGGAKWKNGRPPHFNTDRRNDHEILAITPLARDIDFTAKAALSLPVAFQG